jgi:predicted polyphosphate/ATP-dependent NAD kinase
MALDRFGFIFTGRGLDPAADRAVIERADFRAVMVGVNSPSEAVEVAEKMVSEGIQLIELCGGFGPVWTAKVIEAVGDRVPVGSVGYGPESIDAMAALFPPA